MSWGGPGAFPHRYQAGKEQFVQEFGVEVVETPHALKDPAWLARHPEARALDLMEAFADPSIRGIISTIGGDESIRLLPHIRPDVIIANPKVFLGYSDTTVSHLVCLRAGLVSFYGPAFMSGFAENGGMFPFMVEDSLLGFLDQSSRFLAPVYVGDTLYGALEVADIAPNRSTGVIGLASTVHNQKGELVMDGTQRYLIRKRPI